MTMEQDKNRNWADREFSHLAAHNEGWGVVYTGMHDENHTLYELQCIDEAGVFKDDEDAIRFVVDSVLGNPDGNAAQAVRLLHKESINELDLIFRKAVGSEKLDEMLKLLDLTIEPQTK